MIEPLRSEDPETLPDRRASRRVQVTCQATLQTMTAQSCGKLVDISEAGARFEGDSLPGAGATAVLRWGSHEAVCAIVWSEGEACGLAFSKPLASEIVAETAALNRVLEMPIASVGNISQGQKRSRSFLKRAEIADEDVGAMPEWPVPPTPIPEAPAQIAAAPPSLSVERYFAAEVVRLPVESQPVPVEDVAVADDATQQPDEEEAIEVAEPVGQLRLVPPMSERSEDIADETAPAEIAFGRGGGLPPPTIGHSATLAEILRRYRETGSWER